MSSMYFTSCTSRGRPGWPIRRPVERPGPGSTGEQIFPGPASVAPAKISPVSWDGRSYDVAADPQAAVGIDLIRRLAVPAGGTVVDAGCGSGRVTEALLEARPDLTVVALDASTEHARGRPRAPGPVRVAGRAAGGRSGRAVVARGAGRRRALEQHVPLGARPRPAVRRGVPGAPPRWLPGGAVRGRGEPGEGAGGGRRARRARSTAATPTPAPRRPPRPSPVPASSTCGPGSNPNRCRSRPGRRSVATWPMPPWPLRPRGRAGRGRGGAPGRAGGGLRPPQHPGPAARVGDRFSPAWPARRWRAPAGR